MSRSGPRPVTSRNTCEFELPEAAAGGEIGFAFFRIEVVLPIDGRWVIVVTGGAGVVSLPLMVEW